MTSLKKDGYAATEALNRKAFSYLIGYTNMAWNPLLVPCLLCTLKDFLMKLLYAVFCFLLYNLKAVIHHFDHRLKMKDR